MKQAPYYEKDGLKWKRLKEFNDYFVNESGQIASLKWSNQFKKIKRFKILNPTLNKYTGYFGLFLCKENGYRQHKVIHRIVLEELVGPCPEGCEARHGIKGKLDNSLSNLSWGTHKENCLDRKRDGICWEGSKNPMAKLSEKQVVKIRNLFKSLKVMQIAKLFNVSHATISYIKSGKRWSNSYLTT